MEGLIHPLYKIVTDEKEADGAAWVFLNEKEMKKVLFKFPPLGSDELRVSIHHTGLCQSDCHTVRGDWGKCEHYPIAPGHEVIGHVTHVGSEVEGFNVGDRVGFGPLRKNCGKCEVCLKGKENICELIPVSSRCLYGEFWGGYATSIQQPAQWCFKIPEGLPNETTPPLMCAGITTYAPISRHCKPGDHVAILGIGGLGHLAVQFAAKLGCHVTAFSGTPGKEELIYGLGATKIVNTSNFDSVKKERSKYDVVINPLCHTDPAIFSAYLDLTKPGGTFVQLGLPKENLSIGAFYIVAKEIKLVGGCCSTIKEAKSMLELCAKEKIAPMCEFHNFNDFPKAFDQLEHGRPKFRVVVNCSEEAKKFHKHQ